METEAKKNWYENLVTEVYGLCEELGLDDLGTTRIRDFMVHRAKEQYKAGNKSGIRWAFKKAREGVEGGAETMAAAA